MKINPLQTHTPSKLEAWNSLIKKTIWKQFANQTKTPGCVVAYWRVLTSNAVSITYVCLYVPHKTLQFRHANGAKLFHPKKYISMKRAKANCSKKALATITIKSRSSVYVFRFMAMNVPDKAPATIMTSHRIIVTGMTIRSWEINIHPFILLDKW